MLDFIENVVQPHFNYWVYVIIMMIGLWALIAKNNLIKKLIGMSIFQTAIILFYVSLGVKEDATIPIVTVKHHYEEAGKEKGHPPVEAVGEPIPSEEHEAAAHKEADYHKKHAEINPDHYANPLPHVLMLTAIVVGVATLGVALAIAQSIFRDFGTLEEKEILEQIKSGDQNG